MYSALVENLWVMQIVITDCLSCLALGWFRYSSEDRGAGVGRVSRNLGVFLGLTGQLGRSFSVVARYKVCNSLIYYWVYRGEITACYVYGGPRFGWHPCVDVGFKSIWMVRALDGVCSCSTVQIGGLT